MTTLTLHSPPRRRRVFWEPWAAVLVTAALYLYVAAEQWGGLFALVVELVLAVVIRKRLQRRVDGEVELLERLLARNFSAKDVDSMINNSSERIHGLFSAGSSALLATGMAASAFLLLFYARAGVEGGGIVSVAPKAFVATGYAILCALAFTRGAYEVSSTLLEPLRRKSLDASCDTPPADVAVKPSTESSNSSYEPLITQLVSMQIGHLQALNETNRLLAASASERVDEESGAVRVKLAKGLTDFRKSVEALDGTVLSLGARLDALANEESALLERHRHDLVSEVSRLPQQVIDRAAGMVATSVTQVEDRFRLTLQSIHDEETRRARDLLAGEFAALRNQFELSERSVSAISARFNDVVSSLDALASAFDRSAKSVVASAGDFTREATSLASSVTDALTQLGDFETRGSLLTPLTEAATAVRKASSLMATDLRKVAAERERLGRVRVRILDLLPAEGSAPDAVS